MMDKSWEYQVQDNVRSIFYLQKTTEGDPTFNTSSVAAFKSAASQVDYVVRASTPLTSPDFMQNEAAEYHVWRVPWLAAGLSGVPQVSDKFFADGNFWLVNRVDYTDMDDSQEYQRYKLTVTGSNKEPVP